MKLVKPETIVVFVSRVRVSEMVKALHGSANVTTGENDNPDTVQDFRYACGKNHAKLFRVDQKTERLQMRHEQMFKRTPMGKRFEEFGHKRVEICLKHCIKGEDGTPILHTPTDPNVPRIPTFQFTADGQLAFDKEIGPVETEYSDAVDAFNERMEDCGPDGSVCIEMIEVELHSFPYSSVPKNLNGLHLAGIAEMLTGKPE